MEIKEKELVDGRPPGWGFVECCYTCESWVWDRREMAVACNRYERPLGQSYTHVDWCHEAGNKCDTWERAKQYPLGSGLWIDDQ